MDTQQGRVHDKVTLITGAASGMGESHARVLASQGAKVALADIADDKGTELAKDLNEKYGEGTAVFGHLDVTDFDNWTDAVEKTVEAFGHLDVLVNNAGFFTAGDVEEASLKDWDLTLAIDLTGTFYGMKAAVPELKKRETSSIINISSIAGLVGFKHRAAYAAAKWGVQGLTKTSALDLGKYGIRVNSVHPGSVNTPLTANLKRGFSQIPLDRAAEPTEISQLIVYLASDESTFASGGSFVLYGGETAGNNLRDDQ